jgi:hypothetical protein
MVDMTTLQVTLIPHSNIAVRTAGGSAHWTPEGSYVLFSGPQGPMLAYHPGDLRAITLKIRGSNTFTIA